MTGISLRALDPHGRYKLLCGVVVPRPIGRLFGSLYATQRDRFALARESHGEWLARVNGGNGAGENQ